jgi:hypothetical protein
MDIASRRADEWRAAHQPPAEPAVTVPYEVDYTMDLGSYAEQRAALGVKTANDFGVVRPNESGFMNAEDLAGSATAMAALANPYRKHSGQCACVICDCAV